MRLKNGIFFGTMSTWIKIITLKQALHQGYSKQTIEQALLPEIAIGAWSQGLIIISTQIVLKSRMLLALNRGLGIYIYLKILVINYFSYCCWWDV